MRRERQRGGKKEISTILQHSQSGCCSLCSIPTQGAASPAAPLNNQMMTCGFLKPSSTLSGSTAVSAAL